MRTNHCYQSGVTCHSSVLLPSTIPFLRSAAPHLRRAPPHPFLGPQELEMSIFLSPASQCSFLFGHSL
jgi:hypothetical protein